MTTSMLGSSDPGPALDARVPEASPRATTTMVDPVPPAAAALPEPRRRVHAILREDVYALLGSLAAAVAITAIVFVWLAPFDNPVGFVFCAYAVFVPVYWIALSQDHGGPVVRDRVAAVTVRPRVTRPPDPPR